MGVEILTSPQLSDCVFDGISLGSRVCKLKLKVKDQSLYLLQVCAPNAVSKYQTTVHDVSDAFKRVGTTESTILVRDFNANFETDNETRKGVIVRHGDPAFNENDWYLF